MRYPPNFLVEEFDPSVKAAQLRRVRFYDQKFSGTYPDGQAELGVYTKYEGSLTAWVEEHSASEPVPDDPRIYFREVSNQTSIKANDRSAISFDWEAPEIGTVHVVTFFSGERVVALEWFADAPAYASTIEAIFDVMLDSYMD